MLDKQFELENIKALDPNYGAMDYNYFYQIHFDYNIKPINRTFFIKLNPFKNLVSDFKPGVYIPIKGLIAPIK